MLAAHDAAAIVSWKPPQKLGKLLNQDRHAVYTASPDQLCERQHADQDRTTRWGGVETRAFAKARYRCLQGEGATACLPALATGLLRVIPASEFVRISKTHDGD